MRARAAVGLILVTLLALTCVMVAGSPIPAPLKPLHPVAAAGTRLTGALGSSIGGSITARNAKAAEGNPVHKNGVTVFHNLTYGMAAGRPLLLDAYVPDGSGHAAVIVIHGGGWAHGTKSSLSFEGERLSSAGFAAFVVNYRMAPPGGDWHAPTALEDVRTSVLWVRAHASDYGVDPHWVGVLGNSAGGNLAMMLGTTGTPGADRVEAVVSYSGQSDLLLLSTKHTINAATNYLGCSSTACPSLWKANSPIDQCDSRTAPMLIVNSKKELMPLDQATEMAARLRQLGIPHELIVLDGSKHASSVASEAWPRTITFLRTYLRSAPESASLGH